MMKKLRKTGTGDMNVELAAATNKLRITHLEAEMAFLSHTYTYTKNAKFQGKTVDFCH